MKQILSRLTLLSCLLSIFPLHAADEPAPPKQQWFFGGLRGTFDRGALQRGVQVYKKVCSACHGLKRIRFRELQALGFSPEEIKALAKSYEITDGPNEKGDMFTRPGLPSDAFPNPFKNDMASRAANNGSLPPDLSLITKARIGGADYLNALLTSFSDPPSEIKLEENMHYNPYFLGRQIAMAPPFVKGQVVYADGTPSTVPQMAHDVSTFLAWAEEPETETRKAMGWRVLIFITVLTALMGWLMHRIWRNVGKFPKSRREL